MAREGCLVGSGRGYSYRRRSAPRNLVTGSTPMIERQRNSFANGCAFLSMSDPQSKTQPYAAWYQERPKTSGHDANRGLSFGMSQSWLGRRE